MRRSILLLGSMVCAIYACGGEAAKAPDTGSATGTVPDASLPPVGSVEWKIMAFTAAAPTEIGAHATVMDWPDSASGAMKQLRAGTNGWTCMPSTTSSMGVAKIEDTAPMCLDKMWVSWAEAWMKKTPPKITMTGIGYMLKGDKGASLTDPFAMTMTADNNWIVSGPHIMVIEPDVSKLEGIPSDTKLGGPYVMWKGTPYAHIMVPLGGM